MDAAVRTIASGEGAERNRSEESLFRGRTAGEIVGSLRALEAFRRRSDSLFHRVRASLLIFAACRFRLPEGTGLPGGGRIGAKAADRLRAGDWEEAIRLLSPRLFRSPDALTASALAHAHYRLAFSSLLRQVSRSIGRVRGNEWLFAVRSLADYPLRVLPELLVPRRGGDGFPAEVELAPVRIDPCHSGWSDIFFLAMDYPEGARVVNLSVDIAPDGRIVRPPVECYSRVIAAPVVRLRSLDLGLAEEVRRTEDFFPPPGDPLSLLKAGVVASGLVPPGLEKAKVPLKSLLRRLVGEGRGIEVVSRVRDLPAGSRMAVSTALLNALIARLMRMTGQIGRAGSVLAEDERMLVLSRTILGEWRGGSGGGWQDSGGLWPGIKTMEGVPARKGDPEFGSSRGRLLPAVRLLDSPRGLPVRLVRSLVLVHGGMARNIGPVLEMATEKYLLRSEPEWRARRREVSRFRGIARALGRGDLRSLGRLVEADWEKGTKAIIPQATSAYVEELIARLKSRFPKGYRGFLMLGGASGGGMAFVVDPRLRSRFADEAIRTMRRLQDKYRHALPFARAPRLFSFRLNSAGLSSRPATRREEGLLGRPPPPRGRATRPRAAPAGAAVDEARQESNRRRLRAGEIGLGANRLEGPVSDLLPSEIILPPPPQSARGKALARAGERAIRDGRAAVVTLAGGLGTRWAQGAGLVKALDPFLPVRGVHRSFLEIHLAKSERSARLCGFPLQHAVTLSAVNRRAVAAALLRAGNFSFSGRLHLSPSPLLLRRLVPTAGDLASSGDPSLAAFAGWARERGAGSDLAAADPLDSLHPPGHWFEIAALIRNGTLGRMIASNRRLCLLFVHNLDALGAGLDPRLLALHLESGSTLTFEAIPRLWGDRGGFLARAGGRKRIVEALALPREADADRLSWYNSLSCWISIDPFLAFLGLERSDALAARRKEGRARVEAALERTERRLKTYAVLKRAWEEDGAGRRRKVPVVQCEKLLGDLAALPGLASAFLAVERKRGQQLKDPALLDHWLRDGSREHLLKLCRFQKRPLV